MDPIRAKNPKQSVQQNNQSSNGTSDFAIKVESLTKTFRLPHEKNTSVKSAFINILRTHKKGYEIQHALKDVSFEVKKGEFFGIVGRNGSGKSTLLKLIAGIYTPTSGGVHINGTLTPFIELGVGFNPELTGRENIYLNGALLGFNRKEMVAMYDDIVDFAGLKKFMDQKLKNYSSGMQVRLAFSIAVKAKNDILIFDEVLAVGDEAFQRKCFRIFEEYRDNNQTVILVTHSMDTVRNFCSRALMLDSGNIELIGSVEKVSNAYLLNNADDLNTEEHSDNLDTPPNKLKVVGCRTAYHAQDEMRVRISWPKKINVSKVGVAIVGSNSEYVFGSNTGDIEVQGAAIDYSVKLNLGPGRYYLTVAINDDSGKPLEIGKVPEFLIYGDKKKDVGGLTRMKFVYKQVEND